LNVVNEVEDWRSFVWAIINDCLTALLVIKSIPYGDQDADRHNTYSRSTRYLSPLLTILDFQFRVQVRKVFVVLPKLAGHQQIKDLQKVS
jgi:hypothetical protein